MRSIFHLLLRTRGWAGTCGHLCQRGLCPEAGAPLFPGWKPRPLTDCLPFCPCSQSPTLTLQSTNTHTQSSSSSSDGGLFRSRPPHSLPPGEDGRVEPYVDFAEFYRLWSVDHGEQSVTTAP